MGAPLWRSEGLLAGCLFLMAAILYSAGLMETGFEGQDERRYAVVAKEIGPGAGEGSVRGGGLASYFVMTHMGELYPDKPPLFFWAQRLSYAVWGGVSPWAARFPLFLAAMGALIFVYLALRQAEGAAVALAGTGLLMLAGRFVWASHWARLDIPMCFFVFGALWCSMRLLFPREGQDPGVRWAVLAWVFAGLAILAKGPGGPLWMILVALFAAVRRDWGVVRVHRPLLGVPIMLAIPALWFVPAALLGGEDYIGPMIGTHVVERAVGIVRHGEPWYYFFERIAYDSAPLGLCLPAALWFAWWRRRNGAAGDGDRARESFWLVWLIGGLILFSLPQGKRTLYILPLYPALAALVGRFFIAAAQSGAPLFLARLARAHLAAFAFVGVALGVALLLGLRPEPSDHYPAPMGEGLALVLAWTASLGGAVVFAALWQRRTVLPFASLVVCVWLLEVLAFTFYFPPQRDDAVLREVAEVTDAQGGERLLVLGRENVFGLYGSLPCVVAPDDVIGAAAEVIAAHPGSPLVTYQGNFKSYSEFHFSVPEWTLIASWRDPVANETILLFDPHR